MVLEKQWPADVACTLDTDFASKWGQNNQHVNAGCPLFVPQYAPETANAITASLANSATGHNKDENVIAFDAYNQAETEGVSKTVAARNDQDTASCVAYPIMPDTVGTLSCNTGPNGNDAGNFACNQAVDAGHVLPVVAAFAQNTRDEVRLVGGDGQISGALAAQPGMKQTTYLAIGFNGDQSEKTRSMGEKEEQSPTLRAGSTCHVAFGVGESRETAHCLRSGASRADKHESTTYVVTSVVRRLTPVECERLQGFPDNFTAIPWKKKGPEQCPDGPRYKALGNSMAVPVMRWIGERIQLVDDLVSLF